MNSRLVSQFAAGPQQCYRCGKTVYPTEKLGPVNEAVFHRNCFRCTVCGVTLTLGSYCANPTDSADREVYCSSHKPQLKTTQLDVDTVGMRTALTAQTLYNRSRDWDADRHRGGQVDAQAISIRQAVALTRIRTEEKDASAVVRSSVPTVELDSVGIQGAVRAQRLRQQDRKATFSRHHFFPRMMERQRKELLEAQKDLERRHRAEEDRLLQVMAEERVQREQLLAAEIEGTWETRLQELQERRAPETEKEAARRTVRCKEAEQRGLIEAQFQEQAQERTAELVARQSREMLQLLAKKQQEMEKEMVAMETTKVATAKQKQEQQQEQQCSTDRQLADSGVSGVSGGGSVSSGRSEVDAAAAVTATAPPASTSKLTTSVSATTKTTAQSTDRSTQSCGDGGQPASSVSTTDRMTQSQQQQQLTPAPMLADRTTQSGERRTSTTDRTTQSRDPQTTTWSAAASDSTSLTEDSGAAGGDPYGLLSFIPDRAPSPCAPSRPKESLYTDAGIFGQLDDHVISIAEGGQQLTFTELAEQLTANCMSELEKVRAIFRWITVKDLSAMRIDKQWSPDTPMGLLRGIQYGTETYHVLFMRLCSYTGIHAVEIKGYSKSVGYEPGMQFRNAHKFKNTWNAVFIDGDWRLVQCNWAARHIVFNRNRSGSATTLNPVGTITSTGQSWGQSDSLRYYYDEHYFLTDPEKFVYEFFPFEPKWQLLDRPVSLPDFEDLPFVRSAFFHYGMEFPAGTRATLEANEFGGAALEISLRDPGLPLICHYQFRCAETGSAYYQGSRLDRYIFFSVPTPGSLVFDIHVPSRHSYYLEIFAAIVEPNSPAMYGNQVRLKSVAKFKVVAAALQKRMNPLPNASNATGEWGPTKALRHFDVKPMNHGSAVINFDATQSRERELTIEMWVPDSVLGEAASFFAVLHKNGLSTQALSRFVQLSLEGNVLLLRVRPPEAGVYTLELYLERTGNQPTHVCKYLVRCVNLPEAALSRATIDEQKVKPGPNNSVLKRLQVTYASPEVKFKSTLDCTSVALRFSYKDDLDFVVALSRLPASEGRHEQIEDHSDNCEICVVDQTVKVVAQFVTDGRYQLHLLAKRAADTNFDLCYSFRFDVALPKVTLG